MDIMDDDPFVKHLHSSGFVEEDVKPYKKVNEFLLLKPLGFGSFAKVFLAIDTNTNKLYALKRFRLKELQKVESGVSQLEREINFMKQMHHPNILKLHSVLHDEKTDTVYLVIDFANSGSLLDNKLNNDQIKSIFYQVLSALHFLHSKGFVHQDIKPSNILLLNDGTALLSDFGVGHSFQSTNMVVGSPAYQAPEALDETIDVELEPEKEDVWSLGVTLYQTVFGFLPFEGENVYEIVSYILSHSLEIPPEADPCLQNLLMGMLQVDPAQRLSVDQIMKHPYFAETKSVPLSKPPPLPRIDKTRPVISISATICDASHTFARPGLSTQERLRHADF